MSKLDFKEFLLNAPKIEEIEFERQRDYSIKKQSGVCTMTTIILDDDLINKVVEIGHYQTPEQAVVAILSEYIKTHSPEISYLNGDMADGEIDSLFELDKNIE